MRLRHDSCKPSLIDYKPADAKDSLRDRAAGYRSLKRQLQSGCKDSQTRMPDGVVIWTAPSGQTYVTTRQCPAVSPPLYADRHAGPTRSGRYPAAVHRPRRDDAQTPAHPRPPNADTTAKRAKPHSKQLYADRHHPKPTTVLMWNGLSSRQSGFEHCRADIAGLFLVQVGQPTP
jgi:hypothetical protein